MEEQFYNPKEDDNMLWHVKTGIIVCIILIIHLVNIYLS